jgi:uncharacterized protein DUF5681
MNKNPQNTKAAESASAEYKVGPGKPPLQSRWQKGQSGNPSGRPKQQPDLLGIFRNVFGRPTKILTPDGERTVPLIEGLAFAAAMIALKKGNVRLIEMLFGFYTRITAADAGRGAPTSEADQALLGDLVQRLLAENLGIGAQAAGQPA